MTRREWLGIGVFSGAVVLLASCGGDEDEVQWSQQEPSPRPADAVKTAKESRQFRLAYLEHPTVTNPPKPSILGREVVMNWNSGSIPGMPVGAALELFAIPRKTDERNRVQGAALVVEFLTASAAGGIAAADMVWLPPYAQIIELLRPRFFAPLDRWLQADKLTPLDAFSNEAMRLVRIKGQTLGLPLAIAPGVVGYDAGRLERANLAAPASEWSWPDFIETGKRLTVDTNEDGKPEQWGFTANWDFPGWLPFLLQEGGEIVDLDSGVIRLEGPAAIRALTAWDELGRVHGILPYGPSVTEVDLRGTSDAALSGMRFSRFVKRPWHYWSSLTPMPQGSQRATPLSLEEVLAVPAAAAADSAYEALIPLAHWIGERRVLPAVTAGWQYLEKPDTDHFDLIFPESMRETALQSLPNAKASYAASSSAISYHLFHQVTLPLARGEVVVEQAIDQASNWLKSYLAE